MQWAPSLLILHLVPSGLLTQHVTAPGLPHVERDAHLFTAPAQPLFTRARFACCAAHLT